MSSKKCFRCKEIKPLAEITGNGYCKPCKCEYERNWCLKNPTARKKRRLKHKYGISLEEVDRLTVEQQGICPICLRANIPLVIDHCHKTGRVRGLLCNPCNHTLGFFKDDEDILQRAIDYLQKGLISV